MTAPAAAHRGPIRPTSAETNMQAAALQQGGKPAEVLVKAARDLIVLEAISRSTGAPYVRREAEQARSRVQQHALRAGVHVTELGSTLSESAVTAARLLARYLH